jgi:hypothetical protein
MLSKEGTARQVLVGHKEETMTEGEAGAGTVQRTARRSDGAVARVTVNLREADKVRLEELADTTKLSKNDVIRKALATEAFVQRTLGENRKILVEDAKGNTRVVEFVT